MLDLCFWQNIKIKLKCLKKKTEQNNDRIGDKCNSRIKRPHNIEYFYTSLVYTFYVCFFFNSMVIKYEKITAEQYTSIH